MGRKGGFLTAVKKIVSCGSKQKRIKRSRSSEKWLEQLRSVDLGTESSIPVPAVHSPVEDVKLNEIEDENNRRAYSVAVATAAAAEAAVAAAQAAAEVARLTSAARYGRSKEEFAAIRIQTAFRGYMAKRALRALKGLVRLKSLIGRQSAKRQSATTLKCMQTMVRVQFEVRSRRLRLSEENASLQRQIQLKRDKELEKQRPPIEENWDDSTKSKEEVDANAQSRQEAAVRRECALAYAYLHQQTWRGSKNTPKQTFMDPNNPRWGWSWLERWMSTRPWDSGNTKEQNSDRASIKSNASHSISVTKPQSPKPRKSPLTPTSAKRRPPSPRGSTNGKGDDSKSINSVQSDRWCHRRHSIAGSSVGDDVSLTSCPASTSRRYMASTESTRAKARPPSPLSSGRGRSGTPEKGASPGSSVKKRLSFSMSPDRPRRHSGPPNISISPGKEIGAGQ